MALVRHTNEAGEERRAEDGARVLDGPVVDLAPVDEHHLLDLPLVDQPFGLQPREEEHVAVEMVEVVGVKLVGNEGDAAMPAGLRARRVRKARRREAVIMPRKPLRLQTAARHADACARDQAVAAAASL